MTDVSCFSVLPVCSKSGTLFFVIRFPVYGYLSFLEGEDTVAFYTRIPLCTNAMPS